MKNNNGTKILSIILLVIVIGLTSYIIYDKTKEKESVLDTNIEQEKTEDNNEEKELNYEEIITEIKNKFDFTFEYFESIVSYCGSSELSEQKNETTGAYYNVSKQFNTYNDMYNHLKQYMSEEVINSKTAFTTSKENYIEEDGKLYCATFNKGGAYTYGNSFIEINNISENKISAVALKELIDPSNNIEYKKVNIILEKENNNFIITSYEVQD